ncbi:indolepyruvate oxidoreductase subunit beta [Ruminococcaceae bacterium OttesenSCG-928-L11]|nr:indolepyruvate oxidoreductase subunit beta [Ruminococcaceae bacterium OttesenSCG-928-L11]
MSDNTVKNIMIVGVGGQGTLLASKLLGQVLVANGFDVKVSEVHGMSQRGGSVCTYVRYGKEVASPLIDLGEADIIVAFEALEAARYLPYLKKGGVLVTADQQIDPMPVITGVTTYPENLLEKLAACDIKLVSCDALALAEQAGSSKAVNIVLMGLLARHMDFPRQDWLDAIEAVVPARFLDMNRKAFDLAG